MSPDFYSYFSALRFLLDSDQSVWCLSAWNDNGKEGYVSIEENGELCNQFLQINCFMLTHPCRYTVPYRLLPWSRMDVDQVPLGWTETKMAFKVCINFTSAIYHFGCIGYILLSVSKKVKKHSMSNCSHINMFTLAPVLHALLSTTTLLQHLVLNPFANSNSSKFAMIKGYQNKTSTVTPFCIIL